MIPLAQGRGAMMSGLINPDVGGAVTPAELKTARESLGFTLDSLAAYLGVASTRTPRNWEQGRYPIPEGVEADMATLERFTDSFVDQLTADATGTSPVIVVYRHDAALHAAHPDLSRYTAAWHRAAAYRAARRTGARLEFPD